MPHGSIESFYMSVLRGFTWLDKLDRDAPLFGPGLKLTTAHFAAIVRSDDVGLATPLDDLLQHPDDTQGGQVNRLRTLPGKFGSLAGYFFFCNLLRKCGHYPVLS